VEKRLDSVGHDVTEIKAAMPKPENRGRAVLDVAAGAVTIAGVISTIAQILQ
jgi:hypothetical protein